MIKAVTLDFWDTIFKMDFEIDLNGLRIKKLEEILKKYNVALPQEDVIKIYREVHKEFDRRWIEDCVTLTTAEVLTMILEKIPVKISDDDFNMLVDVFQNAILVNPPALMDGSKKAIEQMAKKYKLGIISDTGFSPGKVLKKILEENGIINYFSVMIFSDEFGRSKPFEGNFKHAADVLGCSISEMAHIGDNERTDVFGAINSGAKGIFYTKGLELQPQKSSPSAILKYWEDAEKIISEL